MEEPTPDQAPDEPVVQGRCEGILTPVLRLLGYLVLIVVIYTFSFVLAALTLQLFYSSPSMLSVLALGALITATATVGITYIFVRDVNNSPPESLGLTRTGPWMAELFFGVLIAFFAMALLFLITLALGGIRITGTVFSAPPERVISTLAGSLVAMAGVAVSEEVIMRGYVLQTLRRGYGTAAAAVVSSLFFGLLHLLNPGANAWAWIGTSAAGFLLAYAYLTTGRLWFPIGIHFGWNFTLGPIFGFPVSGLDVPGLIKQAPTAPVWWTGGKFGPESGLWVIAAVILMGAGVTLFVRRSDATVSYERGENHESPK